MKKSTISGLIISAGLCFSSLNVMAQSTAQFSVGPTVGSQGLAGTGAGNPFVITTSLGNLQIGSTNTNWCQFNASNPRFYLNKDLFVQTGEFIAYGGNNFTISTSAASPNITTKNPRITVLASNGNVGIGTTSPTTMLHVAGSSTIEGSMKMTGIGSTDMAGTASTSNKVMLLNNTTNQIVKTSISDLVNTLYVAGPADLDPNLCMGLFDPTLCTALEYTSTPVWKNNPGHGQIFAMCANVGIGTTTPNYTLDVTGSSRIVGNVGFGIAPNCTTKILASVANTSDEFLRFNNPNGTQFKVDNSGFLVCRDITVTLNSIPDYVFEPNYKLLTIKEVEDYITINKHLPNIPSATEMVENNTTLGEVNMKLLEKIEELTLYIIEQEKRITQLENQISK